MLPGDDESLGNFTKIQLHKNMGELTIMRFGNLRIAQINDETWFVGKDVATALGYKDTTDAIKNHVAEEDRIIINLTPERQNAAPVENQAVRSFDAKPTTVINESGLYSLILSSKLPQAKEFKHWVTKVVLPSIRKHGMYATSDTIAKIKEDPDFLIGILQALQEEQAKSKALLEENTRLKPLADLGTMMHDSQGCVDMAEAAKYLENMEYKIGRNRLIDLLIKHHQVYRNKDGYVIPYQAPVQQGYLRLNASKPFVRNGKEIISQKTVVTPRGLIWLQKLILKQNFHE